MYRFDNYILCMYTCIYVIFCVPGPLTSTIHRSFRLQRFTVAKQQAPVEVDPTCQTGMVFENATFVWMYGGNGFK